MMNERYNFLIKNGIDVEKGIENTGDFDTYNEIILDFIDFFPEEVNKFNKFKLNNDMYNYEIVVHALKSNCRTLGFNKIGEMFYQHELASKDGKSEWISENYNILIDEVKKLYQMLLEYKGMCSM